MNEHEPIAWISPSKNIYTSRLSAVANAEQSVAALYSESYVRKLKEKIDELHQKELNRWIYVGQRLPEDGQIVAFVVKSTNHDYLDGRVLGGRYTAGICGGFSVPGMSNPAYCWMPLPDSPIRKGNENE